MQSPPRGRVLATTCPRLASEPDEPGCLEKGPWHFLKRARRPHAGAQAHARSPASTGQDPVLPCTSHFLSPGWGAAETGSPSHAAGP